MLKSLTIFLQKYILKTINGIYFYMCYTYQNIVYLNIFAAS